MNASTYIVYAALFRLYRLRRTFSPLCLPPCGVFFFVMDGRSFLPVGIKKGGYFGLEIVALWVRYSVYGVLSAL